MTSIFNFFKNHLDIIRPLLFAVIGAACIYLFYKSTYKPQHYIQEDKTINLNDLKRNTDF